jgi:multiple sugar transport system permease protein
MKPILVTLGVFTFLTSWNDFLWPLTVLTDESKYTLPVALANLSGEHVQDTELMMAGAVITVLPGLLVFLALQRSYIQGIVMGSLKE